MLFAERKQFPVMSNSTLGINGAKTLNFFINDKKNASVSKLLR